MSRTKKIDGGFLMLPNVLVDRILKSDLTGVELKVLLLCDRWVVGYNKRICEPDLTTLNQRTGHSRQFCSKALKNLVKKGFLELVEPAGYPHKKAKYRVIFECDSETQIDASDVLANSQTESHSSMTQSHTPVLPRVIPEYAPESHSSMTLHINPSYKADAIGSEVHKPLLKVPQGNIVDSAEKRATDSPHFSKPLTDQPTLSGDCVPLPGNGTPLKAANKGRTQKPKTDPNRLITWFEADTHLRANVTRDQMKEFSELVAKCNQNRFQVCFVKLMKQIVGVPVPEHLKGPGQVFMMLATAAAHQANGGGSYSE
jgi:hypothetical protein